MINAHLIKQAQRTLQTDIPFVKLIFLHLNVPLLDIQPDAGLNAAAMQAVAISVSTPRHDFQKKSRKRQLTSNALEIATLQSTLP